MGTTQFDQIMNGHMIGNILAIIKNEKGTRIFF